MFSVFKFSIVSLLYFIFLVFASTRHRDTQIPIVYLWYSCSSIYIIIVSYAATKPIPTASSIYSALKRLEKKKIYTIIITYLLVGTKYTCRPDCYIILVSRVFPCVHNITFRRIIIITLPIDSSYRLGGGRVLFLIELVRFRTVSHERKWKSAVSIHINDCRRIQSDFLYKQQLYYIIHSLSYNIITPFMRALHKRL